MKIKYDIKCEIKYQCQFISLNVSYVRKQTKIIESNSKNLIRSTYYKVFKVRHRHIGNK